MPIPRRALTGLSVASASLLGLGLLGGCADGEPASAPATASAPIVVPGSPGEPARTIGAGETVPPALAPKPPVAGAADVRFAQQMVPHHVQAIEMADLAAARAARPALVRLADRIGQAQKPEVEVLRQWLLDHRELPAAGHEHSSMLTMPGMASAADLRRLERASGDAFDRLFVQLMVRHHEGAITMAADQARAGRDPRLLELADSVAVEQGVEITRLRDVLGTSAG